MDAPSNNPSFNPLTATATELSVLLARNRVTSVELVEEYLRHIHLHNEKLNAVINVVPREQLIEAATALDHERSEGRLRSPFHGIPFILKDSIWTDPTFKIPTTVGVLAVKDAVARQNADIVQLLVNAGMVLLAKANLSEMAGMRGSGGFAGWSTVGGQTQSPYVVNGVDPTDTWLGLSTPGGSSSGSAVSVAAGMALVAIGVFPVTPATDSIGPMTKSPEDVASMLDIMAPMKEGTYHNFLTKSFSGLRIGFLNPGEWASGSSAVRPNDNYTTETSKAVADAIDKIENAGAIVKCNISLRRFSSQDDIMFSEMAYTDYVKEFATFVQGLNGPKVQTLQELVEFNKQHASICLPPDGPNQQIIEDAIATQISEEQYNKNLHALRRNNKDLGIDKALEENEIDVIIGTPTGRVVTIAALAGYPVSSMPLGYAQFNGRAFGLSVVAPANGEALILAVMSAWQETFTKRQPPYLHNQRDTLQTKE